MKLTDKQNSIVLEILNSNDVTFSDLVKIAELDPASDFRHANLQNVDFGTAKLSGYDFTGADFSGANFRLAAIGEMISEGAVVEGAVWPEGTERVSDDTLAEQLVETLFHRMNLYNAIEILSKAYDKALPIKRHGTVVEISRRLLPWLYVASGDLNLEYLENGILGRVIPLPVGTPTFAEIVMAGFSMRAADFTWSDSGDDIWPVEGSTNINYTYQEILARGFKDKFRAKLATKANTTPNISSMKIGLQHVLINSALKSKLADGKWVSWVVDMPQDEKDNTKVREIMEEISNDFKFLVVSETWHEMAEKEQKLFFMIHKLLHVKR